MGAHRVLLLSSLLYAVVFYGWIWPWIQVMSMLEWFGWLIMFFMHVALVSFGWSLIQVVVGRVPQDKAVTFSPMLGCHVGSATLRAFGRFLLSGTVLMWTVSLGSVLRLCELGGFIHVGPMAVGSETSILLIVMLFVAELAAAVLLPVFAVALVGYSRSWSLLQVFS